MQSQTEINFENNYNIKLFMESSEPTIDMIVKAYIERDTELNLSFDDYKPKYLKKLGYTTTAITNYIQSKFKTKMYNTINQFLLNTLEDLHCNFTTEYEKMINSEEIVNYIKTRETRFVELNSIDNNVEFYQKLTHEELQCLGW